MGASVCADIRKIQKSQFENRRESYLRKEMDFDRKNKAAKSIYAKLVQQYFSFYGYRADNETKEFIEKNYNPQYYSTVYRIGFTPSVTYKTQIFDRMAAAINNGYKTFDIKFISLDEENKVLQYDWIIHIPNKNKDLIKAAYFKCKVTFDELNRFKTVQFREHVPEQTLWLRFELQNKLKQQTTQQEWSDYGTQKKTRGW